MSGHGERPRDPDPAALAELAQAFADDGEDGEDGAASVPGTPDGDLVTARLDAPPDGDPEAVVVTTRVDQVAADPEADPAADVVTALVGAVPADPAADDPAPGDSAQAAQPGGTPPGPAILDADLPDVERPDVDGELHIVEQEPQVEPEPPAPRIIRIDDYSGSVALDTDAATDATAAPADADTDAATDATAAPADADTDAATDATAAPADADTTPVAAGVHGATPATTISISDDELPDAVYVEGSLDREGGGSIIIIEDDDTGDALAPDSERALRRGVEPRMRERRLAVRRAQGRRRLKIAALVVGVVLIVVLALAALGTFFVVRAENVEIYNAVYTDEEMLQDIIDDAVGSPVLLLDTTEYEDRIEAIPWVERASVRTDFPHGLVIELREREAIATYQGDDERFRVLDREGRVLDVLDLYPYAYVLIGGPETPDLEPGEFAPQGFAGAAELAKNLTATVRGRVQLVEVTADGSRLVMYLDDGSTVFLGEARDLLAKLVRLEAVLANGQDREPGLIDVSTADVTR